MGGNVREWVADTYAAYPGGAVEAAGRRKVNRGGSWAMKADHFARTHTRGVDSPDERLPDIGFRCAADLEEPIP